MPLLVFTADRPAEWIAQQDGQTIYQRNVFGRHVKESYELPADYAHPDAVWHVERIINEAINLSQTAPKGPVHVNVPIREPFYPTASETIQFDRGVRLIERLSEERILSKSQWLELLQTWENSDRKLIVGGQSLLNAELLSTLRLLQEEQFIPVVGDVISNLHTLTGSICHQDIFLSTKEEEVLESLRPDLLITFGQSVLSKNLKLFLRKHRPYQHWHIQPAGPVADPFQTLTRIIPVEPRYFFRELFVNLATQPLPPGDEAEVSRDYYQRWQRHDQRANQFITSFLPQQPFGEFVAVSHVLQSLPNQSLLHLANSMPVRYANLLSLSSEKTMEVFANRGTSGIDGSTSTAVGCALSTVEMVTLLTGDVAFFYDRNALWNNYLPDNLRIILLNNHGGNIFRIIDGPGQQPELDEYFETRQPLKARNTAQDAGMEYFFCNNEQDLLALLPAFFNPEGKAKLLEIETDSKLNAQVFRELRSLRV